MVDWSEIKKERAFFERLESWGVGCQVCLFLARRRFDAIHGWYVLRLRSTGGGACEKRDSEQIRVAGDGGTRESGAGLRQASLPARRLCGRLAAGRAVAIDRDLR